METYDKYQLNQEVHIIRNIKDLEKVCFVGLIGLMNRNRTGGHKMAIGDKIV